jgi:GAF domain-containing protein
LVVPGPEPGHTLGIAWIISAHLCDEAHQSGPLRLDSRRHRRYTDQEQDLVGLSAAHASIALAHFRSAAHL